MLGTSGDFAEGVAGYTGGPEDGQVEKHYGGMQDLGSRRARQSL